MDWTGKKEAANITINSIKLVGAEGSALRDRILSGLTGGVGFFEGEPYTLTKEDGEYRLMMKLPFIMKQDVELNKVSDELIVRIGSFRKHLLLPRHVAASKEVKARLEGEYLYIHFKGEDHGKREA